MFGLMSLFGLGCALLVTAFALTWTSWWEASPVIDWRLVGGVGACLVLMVVWALLASGRGRWFAFILVSTLLVGFSALTFYSGGILWAPLALVLLAISMSKMLFHSLPNDARR